MGTTSIAKATVSCLVATLLVIGFTAAPVAAADGTGISFGDDGVSVGVGDDVSVDAGEDGVNVDEDVNLDDATDPDVQTPEVDPSDVGSDDVDEEGNGVPVEVCTNVPERAHENVPYEQLPWLGELPSEAQPPGVPTSVVTPKAVGGILVGMTPNQCEIQDPNDPSFDPRNDNVDPGGDLQVARLGQFQDGGVALIYYQATLNESNEHGPGVSGMVGGLATSQFGDADTEIAVHDGKKEYAVDPRVRYWDGGGMAYAKNDVRLLNSRLGVEVDCDGQECQPGTRGLPNFAEYPAIPAPTGDDE